MTVYKIKTQQRSWDSPYQGSAHKAGIDTSYALWDKQDIMTNRNSSSNIDNSSTKLIYQEYTKNMTNKVDSLTGSCLKFRGLSKPFS